MSFNADKLLNDFIFFIQNKIVGVVIIAQDPNAGPRPNKTDFPLGFVACRIVKTTDLGFAESQDVNPQTGEQVLIYRKRIGIELEAFGPNAMGRLDCLKNDFRKATTRLGLCNIGLGYINGSDVTNSSTVLDTEWEQRAIVELRFNHSSSLVDQVGVVEDVSYQADVNDDTGAIDQSENTTIDTNC